MPVSLGNTTTTQNFRETVLGGGTLYGSGTILIANNPVQLQITTGPEFGAGKEILYPYVSPSLIPLVSTPKDRIIQVAFADAIAGTHAQVSGWLLEPDLAGLGVGNAFSQKIAASGSIVTTVPAQELAFQAYTAPVPISATTEAGGNTIVALPSTAFDGVTRVYFDFYSPQIDVPGNASGNEITVSIFEDGVAIGQIDKQGTSAANTDTNSLSKAQLFRTPSSGNHTYDARAFRSNTNGTVNAGNGGAGNFAAGYLRCCVA